MNHTMTSNGATDGITFKSRAKNKLFYAYVATFIRQKFNDLSPRRDFAKKQKNLTWIQYICIEIQKYKCENLIMPTIYLNDIEMSNKRSHICITLILFPR